MRVQEMDAIRDAVKREIAAMEADGWVEWSPALQYTLDDDGLRVHFDIRGHQRLRMLRGEGEIKQRLEGVIRAAMGLTVVL